MCTLLPLLQSIQAREHLKEISPDNAKLLYEIESSILYVVLSDSSPESEEELIRLAMSGCENHRDVFADKSWIRVVTKNGLYVSQSEVRWFQIFSFFQLSLDKCHQIYFFFSILAMTGWQPLILAPS